MVHLGKQCGWEAQPRERDESTKQLDYSFCRAPQTGLCI